jgi:glycosyltransferase involved in cell wall biosynthesis
MQSLEVIGPFKGSSGYDRHTREFVRQLVGKGLRVQLTNLDGWSVELPYDVRDPLFDGLSSPVESDTVLHFTMPNHTWPRPGKRNVNYTMFEANRIPEDWAARAAYHDLVIMPTESSFRAWAESGVSETKLRICPLGVDGEYFSRPAEPLQLSGPNGRPVTSYRHRFLNISELRPRKNHLGLIRSWIRSTSTNDDAILILKVSAFQSHLLRVFQDDLAEMQSSLGRSIEQAAPIMLITELLPDKIMPSLYHTATHYISMSKGEGWDQPMMEAASAGLSLIAPFHSAYTAYLREEDADLIPARMVPAVFEGRVGIEDRIFFDNLSWWQPDENAAVEIIRQIIAGNRPAKQSPRERIIADFTWEKAANRLISILEEPA